MSNFEKLYKSIVKESAIEDAAARRYRRADASYSIGNELFKFLEDLEDSARLKSGYSAKEKLAEILDALEDILDPKNYGKYDRDSLARKFKMD